MIENGFLSINHIIILDIKLKNYRNKEKMTERNSNFKFKLISFKAFISILYIKYVILMKSFLNAILSR